MAHCALIGRLSAFHVSVRMPGQRQAERLVDARCVISQQTPPEDNMSAFVKTRKWTVLQQH